MIEAGPTRGSDCVPVCRPKLPSAAALLPYLQVIDKTRWYSNHGPLVLELQKRISQKIGGRYVALASSGTSAIVGAILASAGRAPQKKPFCLMPANTFIGSVAAIEQCGYEPYFVDVDPISWQITPEHLADHPMLPKTGLVLVVSAYGKIVNQAPWKRFQDDSGIPVVIDGASMVEAAMERSSETIGPIPVALSFHATKPFSTAEGGAVLTDNEGLWLSAIRTMNFGYDFDRQSKLPSINGKMSEYHAAIGLAELDTWESKLLGFKTAAELLGRIESLSPSLITRPNVASCYALHVAETPEAGEALRRKLRKGGIGYRKWYGEGAHVHPYTSGFGRDHLPVTEQLVKTLTGLPMSPDLEERDAELISRAVSGCSLSRCLVPASGGSDRR